MSFLEPIDFEAAPANRSRTQRDSLGRVSSNHTRQVAAAAASGVAAITVVEQFNHVDKGSLPCSVCLDSSGGITQGAVFISFFYVGGCRPQTPNLFLADPRLGGCRPQPSQFGVAAPNPLRGPHVYVS